MRNFVNKSPLLYKAAVLLYSVYLNIVSILTYFRYIIRVNFSFRRKNYWAFPVHFSQHTFSDNSRALYEQVKNDSSIVKVIFKDANQEIDAVENAHTKVVNLGTREAYILLSKCRIVVVQHTLLKDYRIRNWFLRKRILKKSFVTNLWHGVPFKYVQRQEKMALGTEESKYYSMIASSSYYERVVLGNCFNPIDLNKIVITGSPRHDFLLCENKVLPQSYLSQENEIGAIKAGRKLVLYAPTYREVIYGGDNYDFSIEEVQVLKQIALKHNVVFGFRYHYNVNSSTSILKHVDDEVFFDFSQKKFPEMAVLLRQSDIIITDYSSLFIEAMILNKKLINFAYDYDHYANVQRGFYFNILDVFPGEICMNTHDLYKEIETQLLNGDHQNEIRYNLIKKTLLCYADTKNAERIVNKVFELQA